MDPRDLERYAAGSQADSFTLVRVDRAEVPRRRQSDQPTTLPYTSAFAEAVFALEIATVEVHFSGSITLDGNVVIESDGRMQLAQGVEAAAKDFAHGLNRQWKNTHRASG